MLHLKKHFTEELIQMAILLSLCGVRLNVGLEPYLPRSWHEMILGQTSALTKTQFHNLHNQHSLNPKTVDLEQFFTARRLLGWVHSLDRIQVPQAELETWLVQREPGSLLGGFPEQSSLIESVQSEPTVEQGAVLGSLEEDELKFT
ncbi:endoplasmic reticulum membrane sensor NFE2L1-like isoform X3 [Girardinichthys multiradiatus]|uniref:endoplasmic reticulum membrane sensor NFE2L1-like isoform X3 n=1 Tax=Girardinichthys multiradiatus TaxID=208333 RepID=UPI001FADBF02|nr:endoplasmic reticulum membrane sensor NFE2L1-like isoform X3 [Girardinichthys multiradiatus]